MISTSYLSYSQKHLIPWSEELDSTFSWDFFKKRTITGGFAAISEFELNFAYAPDSLSTKVLIDYTIFLNTHTSRYNKTIYKKDLPPKNILDHERLHFDIYEYHKRLVFEQISQIRVKKIEKLLKKIKKKYSISQKKVRTLQDKYDAETNFSNNIDNQEKWKIFIQNELIRLKEFSGTTIVIELKSGK